MRKGASPLFLSIALIIVVVSMISILVFSLFYLLSDKDEDSVVNNGTDVPTFVPVEGMGFDECMVFSISNQVYTLANSFDATVQDRDSCLEVTADSVTIDLNGFSIRGNSNIDYGVKVGSVSGFELKNGDISNFAKSNVYVEGGSGAVLKEVEISHGADGVVVIGATDANFENVFIRRANNRNLYLRGVNNSIFNHLEVSEASAGLVMFNSHQNQFSEVFTHSNTKSNLKPGERAGLLILESNNNQFSKTEAINNTGIGQSGVLLVHSSFNSFTDLISIGNGFAGLYFEINQFIMGSNDNSVSGAVNILDNNVGLYMRGSYNNTISGTICNSTTRADIACEAGNYNVVNGVFDTVNHLCFDTNNTITASGECSNQTHEILYFDNGL